MPITRWNSTPHLVPESSRLSFSKAKEWFERRGVSDEKPYDLFLGRSIKDFKNSSHSEKAILLIQAIKREFNTSERITVSEFIKEIYLCKNPLPMIDSPAYLEQWYYCPPTNLSSDSHPEVILSRLVFVQLLVRTWYEIQDKENIKKKEISHTEALQTEMDHLSSSFQANPHINFGCAALLYDLCSASTGQCEVGYSFENFR